MSEYPNQLYQKISQIFNFYDEKKGWRIVYYFKFKMTDIIGLDNPCPVIFPILKIIGNRGSINVLGELVGFTSELQKKRLNLYEEQSRSIRWTNLLAALLGIYFFDIANRLTNFQFFLNILNILKLDQQSLIFKNTFEWWYIYLPMFTIFMLSLLIVAYFTIIGVPIKFLSLFRDKNWSEAICVKTSIYILVDLCRDDILVDPLKRKTLIRRMERLAIVTKLIPVSNPRVRNKRKSIDEYFNKISIFVRERRDWVYSPVETTLKDLRRDFWQLSETYILGKYGTLSNQLNDLPVCYFDNSKVINKNAYLNQFLRLIGFLIPLILIGAIILVPNENLPFDRELEPALVFIFISWLLLSVDRYLSLGVIEGLIDLIKGIKDLK